ncbi:MlaD family protein [Parasulfuritortus cantonensis]|uniref:MlaD family protein n=1 Tax=Parasulfuritortus cantonensis TaxID=2528202 RepID=UPI0014049D9F|nr:MlaD family protein [Parasulfuritortus cantonensis]
MRIGLATLALFALLAFGLYWLAGGNDDKSGKRYLSYFQNQSLEGLQINSDVRMQGIKVGKVIDYAILPGEAHKVRVLMLVDERTPVLEGVKAVVARHMVTGLANIDLENPPQGGAPLMRIPEGERYPVIPEGVPKLTEVTNTLEELGASSQEALTRFNTLLSDRNQRALDNTLANLNRITGELAQTMPELHEAVASARRAADQVDGLGGDAREVLKGADDRLARVADDTAATLAAARTTLTRVDGEVSGLTGQVKLTADLAGQDIQTTAQSLRQAGDALQDTGRALANPARVLYGPSAKSLGPGETLR